MTEKSATKFALDHDRLASASDDYEAGPTFKACLNVHGMYETMRFVLRLSPRNHEPRRVCRRLIWVSYAAMGSVSRAA